MARIIIEDKCSFVRHDSWAPHFATNVCRGRPSDIVVDLDGLPSRSIEAAAKAGYAGDAWDHVDEMQRVIWRSDAKSAVRAFLADLEEGDQ